MKDRTLRKRALRAARAVTLGAAILGFAAACPSDGGETDTVDSSCNDETDGQCPEMCDMNNDADCCAQQGEVGGICDYVPGAGCACAIPGPFIAPEMNV